MWSNLSSNIHIQHVYTYARPVFTLPLVLQVQSAEFTSSKLFFILNSCLLVVMGFYKIVQFTAEKNSLKLQDLIGFDKKVWLLQQKKFMRLAAFFLLSDGLVWLQPFFSLIKHLQQPQALSVHSAYPVENCYCNLWLKNYTVHEMPFEQPQHPAPPRLSPRENRFPCTAKRKTDAVLGQRAATAWQPCGCPLHDSSGSHNSLVI